MSPQLCHLGVIYYSWGSNYDTLSFTLSQSARILDLHKFKAFADDKIDVSKKLIFVFGRVENIVGI